MIKGYQILLVGFSSPGFNAVTANSDQGNSMSIGSVPGKDRMTLISQFDNLIIDTTRLYYHQFKRQLAGMLALN